jgi:formylglycine-generating enzyme required for sulfatase activity
MVRAGGDAEADAANELHVRVRAWLHQHLHAAGPAPDDLNAAFGPGWAVAGRNAPVTLYQAWCLFFRKQVAQQPTAFNTFVMQALAHLLQQPVTGLDVAADFAKHLERPIAELLGLAKQTLASVQTVAQTTAATQETVTRIDGKTDQILQAVTNLAAPAYGATPATAITLEQAIDHEQLDASQQALLNALLALPDKTAPADALVQAVLACPVKGLRGYLLHRYAHANQQQGCSAWVQGGGLHLHSEFVNLDLLSPFGADGARTAAPVRFGSLQNLFQQNPAVQTWLLVGQPGGGKTTLMQHYEMQQARRLLNLLDVGTAAADHKPELCIWLRLSAYRRAAPLDLAAQHAGHAQGAHAGAANAAWPDVDNWMQAHWAGEPNSRALPALALLRKRYRLRFLLDGVNEIEPGIDPHLRREAMRGFARWAESHKAMQAAPLFSVRAYDQGSASLVADSLEVRQVDLALWSHEQVQRYCHRPKTQHAAVWQSLQAAPELLELCRLPFNLAAHCALHDKRYVAANRAELFLGLTWLALQRAEKKGDLNAADLLTEADRSLVADHNHWHTQRRVLPMGGHLLRGLHQQAQDMQHQTAVPLEAAATWAWHGFDRSAWLAAVVALGIFEVRHNEQGGQLAVTHQLWLEFFTARALAEHPDRATELKALPLKPLAGVRAGLRTQEPLPGPDALPWEEATKLALQLTSQPDVWIGALAPVNLALAGRAAAGCLDRLTSDVGNQLRADLLARSRNADVDVRLRIEAAEALGLMGDTLRYEKRKGAGPGQPDFIWPRSGATSPVAWVHVPAGTYLIGSHRKRFGGNYADELGPGGKPLAVSLEAFDMAFAPVTNAEFRCFVQDRGYENERWWPGEWPGKWRRGELRDEAGRKKRMEEYSALRADFGEAMKRYGSDVPQNLVENERAFSQLSPDAAQRLVDRWYPAGRHRQPEFWDSLAYNAALQPVVGVSLFEAEAYCRWLSAQSGKNIRLPTEAQWEAAVRGLPQARWLRQPLVRPWPWGSDNPVDEAEWLNADPAHLRRTSPVGVFPKGDSPNGLVDAAGNVWEWTCSAYSATGHDAALINQATEGLRLRAVRGGAWCFTTRRSRAAYRYWNHPLERLNDLGLRVMCCPIL